MSGERRTFADNRDGNTVAEAIRAAATYFGHCHPFAIATGYFDLGGFKAIEDILTAAPAVRLLLGAEPRPLLRRLLLPGEPVPDVRRTLEAGEEELRADRDLLPFSAEAHDLLARFLAFLRRPGVEVRRYTREFLHGKAFVFGDEAGLLAGSANFTRKGLTENLELEIGQYEPEAVRRVRRWFDELWEQAEPYDLAAVYEGRDIAYDPYTIYLRMLLEIYGDELRDEGPNGRPGIGRLRLAEFQRQGVQRALVTLDRWHGVLLADGVGLGKTFMAGGIIERYARERGQRVLVVCPAALREMWQKLFVRQELVVEVLSYQELASDVQVGDPPDPGQPDRRSQRLGLHAEDYRLVVVDEAHALRSPDAQYYRAVRRLMSAGGVVHHLVLLTATPVNNSLWDLYHQVMLFARHDAAFARLGIVNLREFFKQALSLDLRQAAPRHLFPLLNAISVRRTRHHVQRFYPGETLDTADGPREIRFPHPRLVPVTYSFEEHLPGFFGQVADAIENGLTMARYRPDAYRRDGKDGALSQDVLAALLRSQLLKRFESSLFAFRRSLERLIAGHDTFLRLLDRGWVPSPGLDPRDPGDMGDELSDELLLQLEEEGEVISTEAYDAQRLRQDVERDLDCLLEMKRRAESVPAERDPKLRALWELLAECGLDSGDSRKVVVFSYFADTVEYIARHLDKAPGTEAYRGRVALAAGSGSAREVPCFVEPDVAAVRFAPRSMGAPDGAPDRFDLLLATDVLAEGQNLQQACRVVNFDLPWNPMRLAQRNGRVDRIGSPHAEVLLYCFLPAAELDGLLNLEQRLRDKIAQANAALGLESPVLPGTDAVTREFATVRQQIVAIAAGDERVLDDLEEELDAFAGEGFRDELRRALVADPLRRLAALPWGAGSGLQDRTGTPGVVFAARIGTQPQWRFVPLAEDAPCDTPILACLQRARCREGEPRYLPDELRARLCQLWERARESIFVDYQRLLDPAERAAVVPRAQREAVALLRRSDQTDVDEALAALQVPWPRDVVRRLRSILRERDEGQPIEEAVQAIIALVRSEGMRAPVAEELPEPITPEMIALICYQATSL
ncbi:MAG: SNF2-related protein [Bacillota bacterium]